MSQHCQESWIMYAMFLAHMRGSKLLVLNMMMILMIAASEQ